MSLPSSALAALLAPVTCEAFYRLHWEKQPLHICRADPEFYRHLLTLPQLEELIASPAMRFPAIQLCKAGAYLPAAVFTDDVRFGSNTFTGTINLAKLNTEYRAGATVVLPGLHLTCRPLAELCARIDAQLDHVSHANAYLTPGGTEGFTPHYDTHEVLVLQLAGTKRWRVFVPPIELPHRRQPFSPAGYEQPKIPVLEVELCAGDLLYLPRGYVHTTTTSDGSSAHITIGIDVYTWLDLAGEVMQKALAAPRFRTALPPGFISRVNRRVLAEKLHTVLQDLTTVESVHTLVDEFLARAEENKSMPIGAFCAQSIVVQSHTPLVAPDPKTYRVVMKDTKVAIEHQQRRWVLPAEVLSALQVMQARRTFMAADLPSVLDIETRLALVRTLVDKGFLAIA